METEKLSKKTAGVRHPALLSWLHLMRIYDKMQQHSADHLHQYSLTPAQFDVLAQLVTNPGISQQELAERLLVTKGNVCGLIDRLEKLGMVQRCEDPEDRRSNRLHLTEKAQRLAAEAIPAHEEFIVEHLSALSWDQQRTLLALLRDLDRSLARHKH